MKLLKKQYKRTNAINVSKIKRKREKTGFLGQEEMNKIFQNKNVIIIISNSIIMKLINSIR